MTKTNQGKEETAKRNFVDEYNDLFRQMGIDSNEIEHDWNQYGDTFEKFSLYKNTPTTITSIYTP